MTTIFFCCFLIISAYSPRTRLIPIQNTLSRCTESMSMPCVINEIVYACADHLLCGRGSFGDVYKVRRYLPDGTHDPIIYALKLAANGIHDINEAEITSRIQSIVCPDYLNNIHRWISQSEQVRSLSYCPTVAIYNTDSQIINNKRHIAMIMWYYEEGSAANVRRNAHYPIMMANRDGYVYKLINDISYVLEKMWRNKLIDRDVRLSNIMMAGDLRYYTTTSFIKIDHGLVIDESAATQQIVDYTDGKARFCTTGSHASPMDIKIMYGKTYRQNYTDEQKYEKQIEQLQSAKILVDNLESVDIIDLIASASAFYDKLTNYQEDKINFQFIGNGHSETERRAVVEHNWNVLNEQYDFVEYTSPFMLPETIKDLIIKIYWLSFWQLPENQTDHGDIDVKAYLNWNTVKLWLEHIFMNGRFEDQHSY